MLLGVSNATRTPDSDSGLGLWSQQRNHTRRVAGSTDLARTQRGRQLLHDLARCSLHGLRCGVALLPHLALALKVEEHVARSVDDLVRMTVHRRQERIRRQEDTSVAAAMKAFGWLVAPSRWPRSKAHTHQPACATQMASHSRFERRTAHELEPVARSAIVQASGCHTRISQIPRAARRACPKS